MNKNLKFFLLLIYITSLTLGCSQSNSSLKDSRRTWWPQESRNNSSFSNDNICQSLTWNEVKYSLKNVPKNYLDLDKAYSYISRCEIKAFELNDLIDIYSSTNEVETRLKILSALNIKVNLLQDTQKALNFYRIVASDNNIALVKKAIEGLAKLNQINEIVNIYNSKNNDNVRRVILEEINSEALSKSISIENNPIIFNLYKSILFSQNRSLAPIALRGITNSSSDERWSNWGWSVDVVRILEEAVNKDFYKLSSLDSSELLALANKYPNSKFTKACIEYRSFTEGSYFGQSGGSKSVFRQPFEPSREIEFWPKFLEQYPDHPGSDDAMYRVARAYEMKGDYERAILWYYKSFQAFDGDMHNHAKNRILFIVDLLLSSDSVTIFLKKHPEHPLVPYLIYSKAVHFLREDKLELAQEEMQKFLTAYKNKTLPKLISWYYDNPYLDWDFWNGVEEQSNRIKKLIEIQNKPHSDSALYEKAAFWFQNDFLAYNYLWQGASQNMLSRFLPDKWEGAATSTSMSITYQFLQTAREGYKRQNRYLRSISLFEKMLENYPKSELAPKAKYSIALNYYYLEHFGYSIPSDKTLSWADMAIKNYQELIKDFPDSSLADDAMLVIASLSSRQDAVSILEKQLKDYPGGDRYKDAEFLLNHLKNH